MRQRFRIGEVVDRHEVEVLVGERGAKNIAADAAETVNAYFDCHVASSGNGIEHKELELQPYYTEQTLGWNKKS